MFDAVGISYTNYIRTTDAPHIEKVKELWVRYRNHKCGLIESLPSYRVPCIGMDIYTKVPTLAGIVCQMKHISLRTRSCTLGNWAARFWMHVLLWCSAVLMCGSNSGVTREWPSSGMGRGRELHLQVDFFPGAAA